MRAQTAGAIGPVLPRDGSAVPRLRVLVSAYACEPDRGSEAAVGWNWVQQAARFHDVCVITRASNRPSIDAHVGDGSLPAVRWVYHDLPPALRWWKRGRRGLHLYYALWQAGAYRIARRLHESTPFDVVHHVTIATYWMPTFLGRLGVPFIWGPVGGGESGPTTFYPTLGTRGRIQEHLRDGVRWCAERTSLQRAVARSATVAFAATEETAAALRRLGVRSVHVLSQVALSLDERTRFAHVPLRRASPFRVVSVGNLLPLKGLHLGLEAFAELLRSVPDSEYWMVGHGPDRRRLERRAADLGIASRVRFTGAVPRASVAALVGECDVLLSPSLHDSGGYGCVEAMACGRPVVCLDLGGPAALVDASSGIRIHAGTPAQAVRDLAGALRALAEDRVRRDALGAGARRAVAARCDWDTKGDLIYGDHARTLARLHSDAA